MSKVFDVVIVGGGPGGIASAVEASIFKFESILMIEKGKNHSQTIRQYYKDQKRVDRNWKGQEIELLGNVDFFDGTKESTLDYFDTLNSEHLIETHFDTAVSSIQKDGEIFTVETSGDTYQAKNVIISIGRMGKPNKPSYKIPVGLRKITNFSPYECVGDEKILVVGGGDSAVEYACQLTVLNDITIAYRGAEFTRASEVNKDMIETYEKENRLKVLLSTDIDSVEDSDGKALVNYSNGTSETFDRIIYGLGGTTPVDFLKKCNIEVDDKKQPIYNDESYETNVEGLYLAGDIIYNNGGSIAKAINHAFHIMTDISSKR